MKAESVPTTRNRSAFYAYRKRPSPSPSVCSSASSSIASASASARSASRPAGVRRKSSTNLGSSNNSLAGNSALKQRQNSRQGSVPLLSAASAGPSREFEALLEPEYQEDVLAYMAEMAVSFSFPSTRSTWMGMASRQSMTLYLDATFNAHIASFLSFLANLTGTHKRIRRTHRPAA